METKTLAVLITGKAGAGKTTVAEILKECFNSRGDALASIVPIAMEIKRIARDEFGWDGEKDEKGRRLLQVLGTEAGREYNENVWVDKSIQWFNQNCDLANRICIRPVPYCIMIADDVRFPNEIEECKLCFDRTVVIYVCREQTPLSHMLSDTDKHISENSLSMESAYIDTYIYNNHTMEALEKGVLKYLADELIKMLDENLWEEHIRGLEY